MSEIDKSFYTQSVEKYLGDLEKSAVLRPHQREVFEDIKGFFEADQRRGYIELPTGTGKTVLFVELSKAILSQKGGERLPKVLVVVPTKDLVHQTLGREGQRGFGKFAPDISVGSFFSDTPQAERSNFEKNDVVVTTYRSFRILSMWGQPRKEPLAISSKKGVSPMLDNFDVFFLDEAHHTISESTGELVRSLPQDKIVIGFTATPDANGERRLNRTLPLLIHKLELNEAIAFGLLSPVVPIGLYSGVKLRSSNIYNAQGEFLDSRISSLAENSSRNRLIIAAASQSAQRGLGIIISCIAGNEAWHARYLAQALRRQGIKAESVYDEVPAIKRAQIYKEFERGGIDALTYVGVLGEGWDSERAKVLINGRPTRSMIIAKQRFGRITRPGGIAFSIDICDEFDARNPAITTADFLNEGDIYAGKVIGQVENPQFVDDFVRDLKANLSVVPVLKTQFSFSLEALAALDPIIDGQLTSEKSRVPDFAIPTKISSAYQYLTDEIIQKLSQIWHTPIESRIGRQGHITRVVYNITQVGRLLGRLPDADPSEYYIDKLGGKWISASGMVRLFGTRYPGITQETVEEQLEIIEPQVEWQPVRHKVTFKQSVYYHYHVLKMYLANQKTINLLDNSLKSHFEIQAMSK